MRAEDFESMAGTGSVGGDYVGDANRHFSFAQSLGGAQRARDLRFAQGFQAPASGGGFLDSLSGAQKAGLAVGAAALLYFLFK